MPLSNITAKAHPCGYRIDISWCNPDYDRYPGIRIVRCTSHFPLSPTDGDIVLEAVFDDEPLFTLNEADERCYSHADKDGLHDGTTYYYGLFPFAPDDEDMFVEDEKNRAGALATSSYGIAEQLFELLPKIYHRYDQALVAASSPPDGLAPEDREKGPLRRFLDVVGSHLDLIQSHARAVQDLHDLSRVDGRLLPLLAEWIGWRTNYRLGFDGQRRELRLAPSIYETVGIVPTTEATVKRELGWESRTKSFADNVFRTNRPERLNLVFQCRGADGGWRTPADSVCAHENASRVPGRNGHPFSLNWAYEGRPSAVIDDQRRVWLFYHTLRKRSAVTTSVEGLAGTTTSRYGRWDIWFKRFESGAWQPSQPVTDHTSLDRHPSAVWHNGQLWLFWDRWDERERRGRLMHATYRNGTWSAPAPLWPELSRRDDLDRKQPSAVVDDEGGLWLFWLSHADGAWRIEYNRHIGGDWVLLADEPSVVPHGEPAERVSDGPFCVLFHPTDTARRLWLFWQQREHVDGGQHRRRIAWRTKPTLDPTNIDWNETAVLPSVDQSADDVEPFALASADGNVELFWSSNRDRSFSVWHDTLVPATKEWDGAQSITTNPFSQHGPSVIRVDETWLFYGSNESLAYQSEMYSATTTLDIRHAGSTTLHGANAAKLAFLSQVDEHTGERRGGDYQDFNTYTSDTGEQGQRTNRHWYARDTVGLYLTPTSDDLSVIAGDRRRIEEVLKQFLPIQLRSVFIIEAPVYKQKIYTYDYPEDHVQRRIGEVAYDSTLPETYTGASDVHEAIAPGWVWMHSWSDKTPQRRMVDFARSPIDTSARTWHSAVTPGDGK